MTPILITGATGFLGRHVVEAFLARPADEVGNKVRLLCRGPHPWEGNIRVESFHGDILDAEAVEKAVSGMGAVIHLAGSVGRGTDGAEKLFETHIEGTRNVCNAALRSGNPKVLVASSSGTSAVSHQPIRHDETAPYAVDVVGHWPYYLSKIYQEKLAISYFNRESLPVVVLNPSLLLGPGDFHMSSTRDVQLFLNRQVGNVPSGGLNFIDVRDAAPAFLAAVESAAPGRRYLIGGHDMTIRKFFYLIQYVSGVRAPLLSLPEPWARKAAAGLRKGMHLVGRQFPLDDVTIEMAYRYWYCDSSRAESELGLKVRPAEETLRDTVTFIRNSGA